MQRPPIDPKRPILTMPLLIRVGLVSALTLIGAYGLFLWCQAQPGAVLAESRTVAVNTIVMIEAFYLLNCRSLAGSIRSVGVFSNPWAIGGIVMMILTQVFFTYVPFMNRWFQTAPLSLGDWWRITAVAAAVSAVVGVEKWVRARKAPSTP